jgi:sortase A
MSQGSHRGVIGPCRRRLLLAVSVAALATGVALAAQIGWFFHDSSVRGGAFIQQLRHAIASARLHPAACGDLGHGPAPMARRDGGGVARGLLEIPALGLVAPVRQGTTGAVLGDSVGHVRASAWPGRSGTSVFSAHNVTWFSRIGGLTRPDVIRYVVPCRTYTYLVTSHRIVPAGYRLYSTAAPTMVLETCYPADALYLTSTRYLVFARLASVSPATPAVAMRPRPPGPALTVPAPRALAAQGLGVSRNLGPLGSLRLSGAASAAWRQTSAPMTMEAAVLAEYFAVTRSASQERRRWWAELAPPVPVSAADGLWGGQITGYDRRIIVRLRVHGDRPVGATVTTVLTTGGSVRPGIYRLRVTETVTGRGKLLVSGFRMRAWSS